METEANLTDSVVMRIAGAVRDQLVLLAARRRCDALAKADKVIEDLERLTRARNSLGICLAREWSMAAGKILRSFETATGDLPFHVNQLQQFCDAAVPQVPDLSEIAADIRQLKEEFGSVRYVGRQRMLAARTETIELEGVYLGEFEIQLHIDQLTQSQMGRAYAVVAIDPHPAASKDEVTHPHVSDECLCAGDAGAAINMSLRGGRVCDFFLLIRSVLETYNPDSPFVSLNNWSGVACYECGYIASDDDIHWCSCCENDYCHDCSSYCIRCDESTCIGCLEKCSACDESVCPSCMTTCPECNEQLCRNCLEEQECSCHEEDQESSNDEDQNPTVASGDEGEQGSGGFDVLREVVAATATSVGVDAA